MGHRPDAVRQRRLRDDAVSELGPRAIVRIVPMREARGPSIRSVTTALRARLIDVEERAVKGRRMGTGVVALVAAAGLTWAAAPSAQAYGVSPAAVTASTASVTDPAGTVRALYSVDGFQALIDSVTQQVHAQHPNATFRDIVGTTSSGTTTSIRDVTRWQLNYNDVDSTGRQMIVRGSVLLPSWTALITTVQNATVYSRELTEPVKMSPFQATILMRIAGYREPFHTVVYAQPIGRLAVYPHPLFIVDQGADRIAVDTVTGVVAPFRYSVGPTT